MDPENVEFTLNFLTGQVHALFMVTQMLANAQPDPVKVLSLLDALERDGIANMEALPVGDAALDGLRQGFWRSRCRRGSGGRAAMARNGSVLNGKHRCVPLRLGPRGTCQRL